MFPETLTTDRLVLERACHDRVDLQAFFRIRSRDDGIEDVASYLPWKPDETPTETADRLDRMEREWNDGEIARYFVRPNEAEPDAGALAGVTKLDVDWQRSKGRFGIWLRKRFWGRGYSGERAGAMLELAFDRLGLDLVEILHREGNDRSRHVVERYVDAYGGQYDGRLRNWTLSSSGDELLDGHRYVITADEYAAASAASAAARRSTFSGRTRTYRTK